MRILIMSILIIFASIFYFNNDLRAEWKLNLFNSAKKVFMSPASVPVKKFAKEKAKKDYEDYKKRKENDEILREIQKMNKK